MWVVGYGWIVLIMFDCVLYLQYVQKGLVVYVVVKFVVVGIVNVLVDEGVVYGIVVNVVLLVVKIWMWGIQGELDELYLVVVVLGVVFFVLVVCCEGGWILCVSNGQFYVMWNVEVVVVIYLCDLYVVSVGSVEVVVVQWLVIVQVMIELC